MLYFLLHYASDKKPSFMPQQSKNKLKNNKLVDQCISGMENVNVCQ